MFRFPSNFYLLKPFAPHLTIYCVQLSSFSSIFHRLSALILIMFLLWLSIFYFLTFNIYFYQFLCFNKIAFSFSFFLLLLSIQSGLFHMINGLKIIFWNFMYLQNFYFLTFLTQSTWVFFLIFFIFS
uniref:Succinate dehydrogenase subunit 3 n=1 Tax=Pterosiphonia complanata TaxID=884089 RepID=UPI0022FDAA78|nr:Succinate dehydrogenase subunit 3 [Pterosiphonia complanata]WAX04096.1 Succinate dehydrogenase subunit 3 [Pterosiphonia complanata]